MTTNHQQCDVELPAEWQGYFEKRGPIPTQYAERRRYPRFYCRGCAAMEFLESHSALVRGGESFLVFTKEASRSGMVILHTEQLFPGERIRMWALDRTMNRSGDPKDLVVVRCARRNDRCYEIVGSFESSVSETA